ncbi:WD40/YVTN/BNR-like repeat-containing protein [Novosphingobium album (ex Liu et al. 2023)]|uniref:Sortilin N-terminal domain-containing protein n=1 Tax=Novosphingobium album (ex Liu et al. 2023) TaxID=3031130 RepID=A0ABT5WNR9_9SPHN|nr:exo-alpha-sialidase [Novosphingobium album (ex Liu et al. 2023)]MDE8651697.1 hypothetical protein [Novosphingobium album (ex Liu et al. 2023)]
MKFTRWFALLGVSCLLATPLYADYDESQWSDLHYRQVGPWRGGRVTTVTGVPSQPFTFYMGTVGGGVWKTTDAGQSWTNTTDGQISVGSIGAVAVADSNPNIIYAGTGSSKIRSNVSIGRGLYKSVDGAKTWTFMGLRDVGQIATIRVNPANPDELFVASIGNPFTNSKERGVYRSRDGGKTWQQVLFVTDQLGAADVEYQPGNPQVLYATIWHGLRRPWSIISGSTDGGVYKSTDGGDHWTKLGGGLPTGLFGRANIGVSAAAPNRVYALIEAKPGAGLYRSDDAGASWTLVNGETRLTTRPFYYTTLGVDPNNADVVFVGNEGWFKSTDGGKTFKTQRTPHGDNHDVWINPRNSSYLIQANDGGANVSLNGGTSWSTQANQPTSEIYQIAVDDQFPYRLYGAQQDNTTVIVPSLPLGDGQEFKVGPGCETGPIIPKLNDPNFVWGGCKGQFSRLDMRTNGNEERFWIGAESLYGNDPRELRYRFQRVAPLEISPTEPNTIYYGSQYVHRSRDGGVTWEKISPDLTANPADKQYGSGEPITRDATGEEVYSTVYAIRESTLKPGVIWAGSNDGLLWVTQDDGKSWRNITPKGLPPGGRVQNIEPGVRAPGTAYVAIYRYLLGDFAPYLYRTDDYGKTWTKLTDGRNGIAVDEPTRVIREDPERPGLLYAGTEFGMYVSFDRGAKWQSFQLNLPAVPVTDIRLTHGDLAFSTQGRGFWILDNLGVLRQLPAEGEAGKASRLYKPATAIRVNAGADKGPNPGTGPEYILPGAQIDYYVAPGGNAGPVTLSILDKAGTVVRRFTSEGAAPRGEGEGGGGGEDGLGSYRPSYATSLEAKPGMHRFIWDLRYSGEPQVKPAATRPGEGGRSRFPAGPVAAPGSYTIEMSIGGTTMRQPLTIVEDPRVLASGVTDADLVAQFEHNMRVLQLVNDTNLNVSRLTHALAELKDHPDAAKEKALKAIADRLLTPPIRYSHPGLQTHVGYLYSLTNATDQKVGRDAIERYQELRPKIDAITAELNSVLGPVQTAEIEAFLQGDYTYRADDDDDEETESND